MMTDSRPDDLRAFTADIVAAHVSNNAIGVEELQALIGNVYDALSKLDRAPEPAAEPRQPAVAIRSSVKPDHIVCLEDGKKLKLLKPYLMKTYGMTPADYRAKWGLPVDYPMVAPDYAAKRSVLARKMGLGLKSRSATSVELPPQTDAPVAIERTIESAPEKQAAPAAPPARERRTLRLRAPVATVVNASDEAPNEGSADGGRAKDSAENILCQAIARRQCVITTYNKRAVTLAPHILFTRHDEMFLRAVTLDQDGKKPREAKLGTFKLAGLGSVTGTSRLFIPFPGFSADDPAYAGNTVCALRQPAAR
jgi:predicted transcriptional regulator